MVTFTFLVGSTVKMVSISAGSNTGIIGTQSGPGHGSGRACAADPVNIVVATVRAVVANIAPARILAVRRMAEVLVDLLEMVLLFMAFSVWLVPLFAAFLSRESDRFQKADSFSIVTCVTSFPWVGRPLLFVVMILVASLWQCVSTDRLC